MSRVVPVSLLAVLLLIGVLRHGVEAKYAAGKHRSGHRLAGEALPPLEQHQVNSLLRCMALCNRLPNCVAFNFGFVSAATNCQLLDKRACDGLPLVADAAVDYYDVYGGPQNMTAEMQTPFWNDPGCVEDGYCATDCLAEAPGEFCTVNAHCSVKVKPPRGYHCDGGACQRSPPEYWELRTGLSLPRWQLWRLDWASWTWKKLKPGTCSLDIYIKLGVGARVHLGASTVDDFDQTRMIFRVTTLKMELYHYNETGDLNWVVQDAKIPGLVSTDDLHRLKVSWCDGAMAIGPEDNPTLVTGQVNVTQPIDFFMVFSANTASWMYVDSGVADRWLFEDSGVARDAVFDIGPRTYALRRINATNDVTVKYDCMAQADCVVVLMGKPSNRQVYVCVGCWNNKKAAILYRGDVTGFSKSVATPGMLSPNEFNTFTVRYNNGNVTVHYNNDTTPIYAASAEHPITDINIVGIGGCCGYKYVRVARYDSGWRTDTWLTEGSGFSTSDILA